MDAAWFSSTTVYEIQRTAVPYAGSLANAALWLAALLVLVGVTLGVLEAASEVYGDQVMLLRERVSIGVGLLLVALSVPGGILVMRSSGGVGGVVLVTVALAIAATYCVPLLRPLAFGLSLGWLVGGSAGSVALLTQMLGLGGPGWFPWAVAGLLAVPAGLGAGVYGWLWMAAADRRTLAHDANTTAADIRGRISSGLNGLVRRLFGPVAWATIVAIAAYVGATNGGWAIAAPLRVLIVCLVGLLPVLMALRLVGLAALAVAVFSARRLMSLSRIVGRVRERVSTLLLPILTLVRFREALCDTCLRWSKPLDSRYSLGVRTCEKCGGTITFKGGRGRLVALLEAPDANVALPPRVFVRRAGDIARNASSVDVTHVRLPAVFADAQELEQLIVHLVNNTPTHGLRSVRVFAEGGRESVDTIAANWVTSTLSWADSDPLRP